MPPPAYRGPPREMGRASAAPHWICSSHPRLRPLLPSALTRTGVAHCRRVGAASRAIVASDGRANWLSIKDLALNERLAHALSCLCLLTDLGRSEPHNHEASRLIVKEEIAVTVRGLISGAIRLRKLRMFSI